MGTPVATPELRKLTERLAEEYGLPLDAPQAKRLPRWSGSDKSSGEKIEALLGVLRTLGPGDWLTVEHPGLFTPEMQSIHHPGYENVARDRVGVTSAWTNSRVKALIDMRGIELISYEDLYADKEKKEEE